MLITDTANRANMNSMHEQFGNNVNILAPSKPSKFARTLQSTFKAPLQGYLPLFHITAALHCICTAAFQGGAGSFEANETVPPHCSRNSDPINLLWICSLLIFALIESNFENGMHPINKILCSLLYACGGALLRVCVCKYWVGWVCFSVSCYCCGGHILAKCIRMLAHSDTMLQF